MLSFDITDRNIRVVKGVESNGKIKISSAATINLEEGLIVNGHVKEPANVSKTNACFSLGCESHSLFFITPILI